MGKLGFTLYAHLFDLNVEIEFCETLDEEDNEEKETDNLKEDKIVNEALVGYSLLENNKQDVYERNHLSQAEFNLGVQTPPPEYIFNF